MSSSRSVLVYALSARVRVWANTRNVLISCRGNNFSSSSPLVSVIGNFSTPLERSLMWQDSNYRTFATSGRNSKEYGNRKKKSSSVLANEDLVVQLIRNASESSADKVTVRLVTDEGPESPSTVQIVSLSEAIEISLDREADLIGANIDSKPPVLRATQLSKLEYKHQQAQKKQRQSSSNRKETKSFRFKAGIDVHDLERKIKRLKGFLIKGHDCRFTVFARLRTLRQNPEAGIELIEQIKTLLVDYGDMKRAPQTDEKKQFYRVHYQPKSGNI